MRLRNLIGGIALSLFALGAAASAQAQTTATLITVTNKPEQAVIGGTVTVGNTLTITVSDAALTGGQEAVSYVVKTGDTQSKIATALTNAIKADANLVAIGVTAIKTAESSKQIVTISSKSPNTTSYSGSVNSGGTETITLSVNTNVAENASIGGTATIGDTLNITVTDAGLTGGLQTINYTVVSGDTPTTIATGLAANATANKVLKGVGITATSASGVVTLKSISLNATTYSASVTGTTETIGLSVNPNSIQDVTIAGTPAAGNVVALALADTGLSVGQEFGGYLVKAGDSVATICGKLKTSINSDTNLGAIGVDATCASGVLSIESNSPNQTNFAVYSVNTAPACTLVTPAPWARAKLKSCGTVSANAVSVAQSTLTNLGAQTQGAGGPLTDAATKLQASTYTARG